MKDQFYQIYKQGINEKSGGDIEAEAAKIAADVSLCAPGAFKSGLKYFCRDIVSEDFSSQLPEFKIAVLIETKIILSSSFYDAKVYSNRVVVSCCPVALD